MSDRIDILELLAAAVAAQAGPLIPTVRRSARPPDTALLSRAECPAVYIVEPRQSTQYQPAEQGLHRMEVTLYLVLVEFDEGAAGMARIGNLVDIVRLALDAKVRDLDRRGGGLITNLDVERVDKPVAEYPLFVFPFTVSILHYRSILTV